MFFTLIILRCCPGVTLTTNIFHQLNIQNSGSFDLCPPRHRTKYHLLDDVVNTADELTPRSRVEKLRTASFKPCLLTSISNSNNSQPLSGSFTHLCIVRLPQHCVWKGEIGSEKRDNTQKVSKITMSAMASNLHPICISLSARCELLACYCGRQTQNG